MEKETKIAKSAELRGQIEDVSALVLVDFNGLSVAQVEDLRGRFREAGCNYRVHKNSVIRYAVADTKHEPIVPLLKGTSGLAFNAEDPGAPARIAREFAKDNEKFSAKGGIIDGDLLDVAGINKLADMPGPQELKTLLVCLLSTPATQMVRVLNAPAQNILNVINAKKDKEQDAA